MSEAALEPLEMPDAFSKATKGTKSKSFARRAIGYLPFVANTALTVANAANAAGFVNNPHLKTALHAANAIKKHAPAINAVYNFARSNRHSLRR